MKKIILFSIGFAITASTIFLGINGQKDYYKTTSYLSTKQFASMKGLEMLYKMKANQTTGLIDYSDVMYAKNQLDAMRLNKAGSFPLLWEESGPDNVGGRCRTILIDRNNPNILFAAGVSGGIFKSTNAGASWNPINDAMSTLAFQSSCQTIDGTIYFGSGENTGSFGGSGSVEGSAFPGEGIFKSTDGKSFTQIASTASITYVNAMASAPDKNIAYAATNTGLKYSENGGAWTNLLTSSFRDVKVATNGNVIAYGGVGNKIWKSTTGTVGTSYVAATGIGTGHNRLVIAISPQDPNYVYVLASTNNNFGGLYQSIDGGSTFTTLVKGGSTIFNPLNQGAGGQGDYDLCVAVHPRDKKRVFMGGVILAEWTEAKGPFEAFGSGLHSDLHCFTFDTVSTPHRMYVGNDGGVYRSSSSAFITFNEYNIGFNVTQFYGIAASITGDIIGGTQDNGTQYINKVGTEKKRSQLIYGGDGFRCEISEQNPNYFIGESYYGNIGRSFNKGTGISSILDKRVPRYKLATGSQNLELDPKGTYIKAPFNTPLKLAEKDSTLSRLYVGADECIWMVEHVFNQSKSPTWFKVSTMTNAFVIEQSQNGKYIFAGKQGQLVRINVPMTVLDTNKNLNSAIVYPGCTTTNITGNLPISSRFITGIGVDYNDSNRLLVTLGNYSNTTYIYYTENALAAVPTWKSVQGNLPPMPVYDAEFVNDNPNMVVVGTEFGVFGTTNISAGTVSWTEQNTGKLAGTTFPRVATYELRQVNKLTNDQGSVIVAGTHGRGIFETRSVYTGIKNTDGSISAKLSIYPNPAIDYTTIQYSLTSKENITINVMDLNGKVVYSKQLNNETPGLKKQRIETEHLPQGTYIVQVLGISHKGAAKMIIQK
jgi:hypothetical protein